MCKNDKTNQHVEHNQLSDLDLQTSTIEDQAHQQSKAISESTQESDDQDFIDNLSLDNQ